MVSLFKALSLAIPWSRRGCWFRALWYLQEMKWHLWFLTFFVMVIVLRMLCLNVQKTIFDGPTLLILFCLLYVRILHKWLIMDFISNLLWYSFSLPWVFPIGFFSSGVLMRPTYFLPIDMLICSMSWFLLRSYCTFLCFSLYNIYFH